MRVKNNDKYIVLWSVDAELALIKHKQYFNVKLAYRNSFTMLSYNPHGQSDGMISCGIDFDGYYWTNINNVILFYRVDEVRRTVYIDGCASAITGDALKSFYGEFDPWTDEE